MHGKWMARICETSLREGIACQQMAELVVHTRLRRRHNRKQESAYYKGDKASHHNGKSCVPGQFAEQRIDAFKSR